MGEIWQRRLRKNNAANESPMQHMNLQSAPPQRSPTCVILFLCFCAILALGNMVSFISSHDSRSSSNAGSAAATRNAKKDLAVVATNDTKIFIPNSTITDSQIAYELAKFRLKERLVLASSWGNQNKKLQQYKEIFSMIANNHEMPSNLNELKSIVPSSLTAAFWYSNSSYLINSIRIPKAASSLLSVIARALVGCKPDGYPCCKGQGSPRGSCPLRNLYCPLVQGCTDHKPKYKTFTMLTPPSSSSLSAAQQGGSIDDVIVIPEEPIITYFRHPQDRLISAFFYDHPHRPRNKCFTWVCFQAYVKTDTFQNVLTKMMYGNYSYSKLPPDVHPNTILHITKRRLCQQISWFGLVDVHVASLLLLYETAPFIFLKPNHVLFNEIVTDEVHNKQTTSSSSSSRRVMTSTTSNMTTDGLRINQNKLYRKFKQKWGETNELSDLIKSHNLLDYDLYHFVVHLFCARVQKAELLPLSQFFKVNPFTMCQQPDGIAYTTFASSSVQELCLPFD